MSGAAGRAATTKRIDVNVDVSGVLGANTPLHIVLTVYLPALDLVPAHPLLMVGLPGGGYSRRYYDLDFERHTGYSQAEYHTARGTVFVALDHLGVGQSSIPDLAALTIEQMAAANDRAVGIVARMLEAGSLDPAFPPLEGLLRIGIGQSMGGCIGVVMQGRHRSFDAYAVLGYSVLHTALPQRPGDASEKAATFERGADLSSVSIAAASAGVGDFSYGFHWDDEPAELVAADLSGGFPLRVSVPPFGSATTPYCALQMLRPGCVSDEAALIDVPLFLGFGERDVCAHPHREPQAFPNSPAVALYIVPRMAHMHNFAGTRQILWERLQYWADGQARSKQ